MKNKQFTCPVSMAVTEEQFNNDLRQPLIDLGYEIKDIDDFSIRPILATNFMGISNWFSNLSNSYENSRHFIDTYNPKLFLALASLTNESTETKEEVLARFEKGEERELIGYRFKSVGLNKLYMGGWLNDSCEFDSVLRADVKAITKLTELNLLDTFCEPVYAEPTISIEEAERILRSFGRTEKIKA